ncbi:hypothetical protein ACODT3_42075 [Streptomyces sp. 4.24]|uniref:hypothetical protein n=1 Tax=Streptomyces tritrimontium TaxID=3406573 RepID=UPI003BB7101C
MTRTNGARLLLVAAVALLLLTCTVAAWALPHTRPAAASAASAATAATAATAGTVSAPAAADPCRRIIGPAGDYCRRSVGASDSAVPVPSRAGLWLGGLDVRSGLLLFSTAAIAAAIGLVSSAGRRL